MSVIAFLLVLISAFSHVGWNLLAKKSKFSIPFYAIICTVPAIFWLQMLFWTPVDYWHLPCRFWLSVILGCLSEFCYCGAIVGTYRRMDMSTAYPLMRSLAIPMTMGVSAFFGLGAALSPLAKLGMMVVFLGCFLMPLHSFSSFRFSELLNPGMLFVLLVSLGTTGYTIFDSISQHILAEEFAEISKPVRSLTFYAIRCLTLIAILWSCILLIPSQRAIAKDYIVSRNPTPWYGGLFAVLSYPLVILAMNYVNNVSYIQAFRQLGMPMGLILGIVVLKEPCTLTKCLGCALLAIGLIMTCL